MVKRKKGKGKRRFKGTVSRNSAKQARGSQLGHLNLPKGMGVFREQSKTRVRVDIMPYEVTSHNHPDRDEEYEIAVEGSLWYKRPYWLHRNIGASNEPIVCPSSEKKKCPICEHRAQLLRDGADWNDDSVRALKPSMRNLYAVIPKGHKDYDETIHIWDSSQFLFQEKLNEEIQENEKYETFPDLEEGYTLKVRFGEEQLGGSKFAPTSRIDFEDREEPYDEAILEEVPALDEILIVPTYKETSKLFFGGLSQDELDDYEDEDEYENEDEIIDEDDDDDDEDEDEDEEPDETPESSGVYDDDDEDEDEDEEPVKKKKEPAKKGKVSKKGKKTVKCPHGHTFGDDCEEFEECDDCEMWEECLDASGG